MANDRQIAVKVIPLQVDLARAHVQIDSTSQTWRRTAQVSGYFKSRFQRDPSVVRRALRIFESLSLKCCSPFARRLFIGCAQRGIVRRTDLCFALHSFWAVAKNRSAACARFNSSKRSSSDNNSTYASRPFYPNFTSNKPNEHVELIVWR